MECREMIIGHCFGTVKHQRGANLPEYNPPGREGVGMISVQCSKSRSASPHQG